MNGTNMAMPWPAAEAEVTYRRERVAEQMAASRSAARARRAANERRVARARHAQAIAAGQSRGLLSVLRGWSLSGSGVWHGAR